MEERTFQNDCILYDVAAEEAGITVGAPGWEEVARQILGCYRPCGPNKFASPRCESGKRNYCTCDTCF